MVEDGVDGRDRRHAQGAGGQAGVEIGVVGRIDLLVAIEDALEGEVADGVLHRGVGLEEHAAVEAVEVKAGDGRILVRDGRFLLNDGGQDGDFHGREADLLGAVATRLGPEGVVFALHAAQQLVGRDVPIDLVGVGDEHRLDGLQRESQIGAVGAIVQKRLDGGGVDHELIGEPLGEVVLEADVLEGDADGRLVAATQIEQQVEVVHARADGVAARGHASVGVSQRTCGESERLHLAASGRVGELTAEAVERVVGADVDVGRATRWGEVGGQEQVGAASTADDHEEEQEGDDNFLNHPYAETSGV